MKNFFVMIFMLLFMLFTMIPSSIFAFPGSPYPATAFGEGAIGPLVSLTAIPYTVMPFSSNYVCVDSGGDYALGCVVAGGILYPVVADISVAAVPIPDLSKSIYIH